MRSRTKLVVPITVCLFAVLVGILAVGAVTSTSASGSPHGTPENFTLDYSTHQPGATDVTITVYSVDPEIPGGGYEQTDWIVVKGQATDFSNCGAANARSIGVDRGNNNSGTETDEPLTSHVKEQNIGEDSFIVQFYKEGDIGGEPLFLNAEDQLVARLANCYQNPDEPGWYQWTGKANGTSYNGDYVSSDQNSHYVYICDCENREEAVQTLGPPPGQEGNGGATPTDDGNGGDTTPTDAGNGGATPTPTEADNGGDATPTEATGGDGGDGATPTDGDGGDGGDATPTDGDGDGGDGATPTDGDVTTTTTGGDGGDGGDGADPSTPTVSDGQPGFGPLVAILALLGAALLALRRRD